MISIVLTPVLMVYTTHKNGDFGMVQMALFEPHYPLVNVYITMERSTIFPGKIHYFDWAMFKFANC